MRDAIASGSHGRSAMPPVALDNHALLPERMPVLRVLNFVDLTGAGDPTGFLKGLTADIITAISRQGGIVVMAEPEPENGESLPPLRSRCNTCSAARCRPWQIASVSTLN